MNPMLFNLIRRVVDEFGGPSGLADALCDQVGDQFFGAIADQAAEYRDDPPPRHIGMTETESAVRWCPFTREVINLGKKDRLAGNRYLDADGSDYANPAGARCIGSLCMCWRWTDPFRGFCGAAGPVRVQPAGEPRRLPNRTPLPRPTASEQRDLFDPDGAESCRGGARSTAWAACKDTENDNAR
jgi:hypothetical protein